MKKIQLLLFVATLTGVTGFSQTNNSQYDIRILSEAQWLAFDTMLNLLTAENKIARSEAEILKLLSSNAHVFKQTPDSVVKQHGKLSRDDVKLAFRITSANDDYLIMITSYLGFCHSFKYVTANKSLTGVTIKNRIVLSSAEELKVKRLDESSIIFYAGNSHFQEGDWIKYFSLDLKSAVFTHTKNCRTVENKEECEIIGG
ncbi:MAG TPA: hypothetical protein VD927_01655 [Chryseosolibacter sp.]|nr:hypothetical protein [Chryseosolibacter sp.]